MFKSTIKNYSINFTLLNKTDETSFSGCSELKIQKKSSGINRIASLFQNPDLITLTNTLLIKSNFIIYLTNHSESLNGIQRLH